MTLTPSQEMALSELLFKALFPDKCWHELYKRRYFPKSHFCLHCAQIDPKDNPNLFTPESFLVVWNAVIAIDREGFKKRFCFDTHVDFIAINEIASPHFPLAVLRWLLEKDGKLNKLKEIINE